ncbi:MAG TPA: C25 family cysteine peptidase, partial [Candidatus Dormibacteraeota bacterium]|nr:C25 family cysteine peptidase [Candidatus Dormibacteraeota bacterium]
TYEGQSTNGPWTSQALMVADENDTENFTKDSQLVQAQLPSTLQVTDVFATTTGITAARQDILADINSGQLLVNYVGHGSEEQWSGTDLFDNSTASSLTNGSSLPVFLIMDCLNGFFQDVYEEPLAVTLMLAPNGGAVAVLASSGLNQAPPQTNLDKLVVQNAFNLPPLALGDAILKGKAGITDLGVRKTFILFGDPSMQIKMPGASPAH